MNPTPYSRDGKAQLDPLEIVKRKIFLLASPIGILSMLIVWGLGLRQGSLSQWDFVALPFLGIVFLIMTLLLWRRVIFLHTFELVVFTLVMVYAISEFLSVLSNTLATRGTFTTNFTIWIPITFLLAFLILDVRHALISSAVYLGSMLAVGIACLVRFGAIGIHLQDTSLLVQIYLASAVYIVVLYLMSQLHDHYISEHSVVDAMSKLAMTDPLTKMDNRRLLDKLIREEINRTERHAFPLSVLLFDLDYFKKINDNFGHNTGDQVLQEVAGLLRQKIRVSDPFGRWGGDEFLCLATNTDGTQAAELADRLREALERNRFSRVGKVTASFGVTTYQPGDTPETLVRRADMGLYKAKASGRNRVEVVYAGITLPLFEGEKPYPNTEGEND
jgi:diguanylate cyclase (GGDEF)-like protein